MILMSCHPPPGSWLQARPALSTEEPLQPQRPSLKGCHERMRHHHQHLLLLAVTGVLAGAAVAAFHGPPRASPGPDGLRRSVGLRTAPAARRPLGVRLSAAGGDGGGQAKKKEEEEAARRERFRRMQEEASHMFESRATQLARQAQRLREEAERMQQEQQQQLGRSGQAATARQQTTTLDQEEEDQHQHTSGGEGQEEQDQHQQQALLDSGEWLPTQLRQALLRNTDGVSESDMALLRREVFGLDTFYVTNEDRRLWPRALLFEGNLRGQGVETTMDEILQRLHNAPNGLSERVSLFLLELRPSVLEASRPGGSTSRRAPPPDAEPVLVFLAAPASLSPDATPLGPVVAGGCVMLSGLSSLAFVYSAFANNQDFFDKFVSVLDVGGVLGTVLPVVGGILGLQAVHELAHRAVAKQHHLKLGLPFLLPSLELGIFGAITPLQSFPPNRRSLFDVALAGPGTGLVLSLLLFCAGLLLTPASFPDPSDAAVLSGAAEVLGDIVSTPPTADFPMLPLSLLHQSYLLSLLSHVLLPHLSLLHDAGTQAVAMHPLALVGLCGTLANAFNLLPVGRLDGGRAFTSAFGRAMGSRVAAMVLVAQALLCAVSFSGLPLLFVWGMLFNTIQRRADAPPRDDLSEVGEGRQVLLVASLFLVFLALIPWTS